MHTSVHTCGVCAFVSYESYDECATYAQRRGGKTAPLTDDKPPAWAYLFGKILSLHDLRVSVSASMHSTEVEDSKNHILKNLMQMRAQMLDYPTTMPSAARAAVMSQDSDLGIVTFLFSTVLEDEYEDMMSENFDDRHLTVHLGIDKHGRTSTKPRMRVMVLPNQWCAECGVFEGLDSESEGHCRCV